eukprot:NODE_11879_length_397_cov_2.798851_g10738_i0.p3 GENE.NODE_11879_length_397_cov_2.798851_g10738_i0~~NODE_11879_length_397_cov_2.798851_g10738_i0.p3  ORF type:complete len:93 (-),score=4.38 NODE_11879_length_397_cov_2.798851_g10738_i0:117-359(-)
MKEGVMTYRQQNCAVSARCHHINLVAAGIPPRRRHMVTNNNTTKTHGHEPQHDMHTARARRKTWERRAPSSYRKHTPAQM